MGLGPPPLILLWEVQMDRLVEAVMKDRNALIEEVATLGIPRDILENLSMDSLRTILSYEMEAQDGPKSTPTTGE